MGLKHKLWISPAQRLHITDKAVRFIFALVPSLVSNWIEPNIYDKVRTLSTQHGFWNFQHYEQKNTYGRVGFSESVSNLKSITWEKDENIWNN